MAFGKPLDRRVWLPLLSGFAVLAMVPAVAESSDPSPGLLNRARQVFVPDRAAAPPIQNVSIGPNSAPPQQIPAARSTAPAAKNDSSAQTSSWWQRFSRKPRRTAYDFWSQDRLQP